MKERFKPCPFCGGTKLSVTPRETYYELRGRHGSAALAIRCEVCYSDLWEHSRQYKAYDIRLALLRKKWNGRAEV